MKPIFKFILIGFAMLCGIVIAFPLSLFSYDTNFLKNAFFFESGLILFFGSSLFFTSLNVRTIRISIFSGILFAIFTFFFSPNDLTMYKVFDNAIPHDRSTCDAAWEKIDDHSIGSAVGIGIQQLMTSVACSFAGFLAVLRLMTSHIFTRISCFLLGILLLLPLFSYLLKKTTGHQLLNWPTLTIVGFFMVVIAIFSRKIIDTLSLISQKTNSCWPDGLNMNDASPSEALRTKYWRD